MSKNCGIYLIKNLVNNKVYIGSSKNIKSRIWSHKNRLRCNKHANNYLQNSWNKYKEESFIVDRLEYCSEEELFKRERWWMQLFQSNSRDYGYNIAEVTLNGGPGHDSYTKQKISEGRKRWYKNNPDKSNTRPVKVVDLDTFTWKEFGSIKEAAQYYNKGKNWHNSTYLKYLDKKANNNLIFISADREDRKELLYKIYLQWLKVKNGYYQGGYQRKQYKSRAVYTMNIYTQEVIKHSTFTVASRYVGKSRCLPKKFITEDKYLADHIFHYTSQGCQDKYQRIKFRVGRGNRLKKECA